MNERGFLTIIGICFLLAVCIVVKGFSEVEKNHSYEVADFQTETELKFAAENALFESVEKVRENPALVPEKGSWLPAADRQIEVAVSQPAKSERLGKINVRVFALHGDISKVIRNYEHTSNVNYRDKTEENSDAKKGFVFISVAECESKRFFGKIYQSVSGYFFPEDSNIYIVR